MVPNGFFKWFLTSVLVLSYGIETGKPSSEPFYGSWKPRSKRLKPQLLVFFSESPVIERLFDLFGKDLRICSSALSS